MNIKIDREILLPTLNLICSVVEKRQTLPILANLYFSHENGKIHIVGTDLEVEISEIIEGAEGENGSFTISSRKILDISRMLPENASISLKREKNNIIVSSGRSRYTLQTLEAGDFPRIEADNWEERFKIKQIDLNKIIDKTSFSMAIQDVRYYLNGILFELEENRFRAIATDGHRLAQSHVDLSLNLNSPRQLIIPRKAVMEINRFLDGESDTEIILEVSKNHLKLTKDNTVLITKLIDGKFPEFKEVLQTELNILINSNRTEFIETMNRVAILTTDRFKGVRVSLQPGMMRIIAKNSEQEEAIEEMEIDYDGEPIETGYNISYLIEAAKIINTENIEIHLQGNDGICIIKQPGDTQSIWLVMPMRI